MPYMIRHVVVILSNLVRCWDKPSDWLGLSDQHSLFCINELGTTMYDVINIESHTK